MNLVEEASKATHGRSLINDSLVEGKQLMLTGIAESRKLRHRIITEYDDLLTLREDWGNILRRIEGYSPSMTFEWMHSWLQVHRKDIESLFIIEFRDDSDSVVGIVPFYGSIHKKFGFELKILEILGGRDRYLMDFVVQTGLLVEVLDRTIEIVKEQLPDWDFVMFRRLNNRRASALHLERVIRNRKLRYNTESYYRVPEIALQGDFDTYFSGLKKHFRKEMRRKNRKLENFGKVHYTFHKVDGADSEVDTFIELEDAGWKGQNGSSLLRRGHLLELYQNLLRTERCCVEIIVFHMWLDDKVIASSICLKTHHALFVNKITYDEDFGEASPGLHLRLYEIEYAINEGLRIYSFSGVEKKWMSFFTRSGHHSMDFIIYSNHLLALLRYVSYTKLKPFLKNYPDFMSFVKHRLHL